MENERIDFFIQTLAEISAFLVKAKHRNREMQVKAKISETVENYLDGFFTQKKASRSSPKVVSQRNKSMQSLKIWSQKEIMKMPYLKDLKYRVTIDGIHQFRYRRDGYNVSFNSKDFETAKKKAYDFIKNLKSIVRNSADVVYGKKLDYVAYAWLELKSKHTVESTYKVYRSVYENHIRPVFGNRAIKSILPIDLQPFFDELFSRKEKTCEDAKIVLNGIFDYAMANRLCPSNPLKGVIVEKHYRKTGTALSSEQIERFNHAMQNSGSFGLACLIILYSGIRGYELNSLEFDWEKETFVVLNAKLKKSQKSKPENLTRELPIFPGLMKLREKIEQNDNWRIKPKTLSVRFSNYWTESTVKDLRHTFASKCREAGIDNEIVSLWQGHAPGKNVTAQVYTHYSLEYQKLQAKKLTNY